MARVDQARVLSPQHIDMLKLLPSGSFFARPHQYVAAQDSEGLVYIRLPMIDWEKIVREAAGIATAAEWVHGVAIESGRVTQIADGTRIIDLHIAA